MTSRAQLFLCTALGVFVASHAQQPCAPAYVNTSRGTLRGNALPGGADEFIGIPFASAERFGPSTLSKGAYPENPLVATYYGPACLQTLTPTSTYGREDCLVMNVWRPHGITPERGLPVLVYIYGGSDDFGEAEPYNASQLAIQQGAVVASFNYRTGPLGFLAFEEDVAAGRSTGNFALLDMQTALHWVQGEIAYFGGDPAKVAIFGQSSGAGCVELLTVSPLSRGLFRGAISQSGGLSAGKLESSLATTTEMARRLNCTERGYSKHEIRACLRDSSGDDIVIAQGTQCVTPNDCHGLGFGPTVDGVVVPADPTELVTRGEVLDVALVLGANTNDTNLFVSSSYGHVNRSEYVAIVRSYFGQGAHAEALAKRALELYPPHTSPLANNKGLIGWLESDQTLCRVQRSARSISKISSRRSRTFVYRYNWWFQSNARCTAVPNWHPAELGSMHQDEVSFVFGQPIKMNIGYTNCSDPGWPGYDPSCTDCVFDAKEANFSHSMGTLWVNMAACGTPSPCSASSGSSNT
eukprot:gene21766-26181_t